MKTPHCARPNPLLSFTVSPSEYKILKEIAEERGVTIAQVGRGFFRLAIQKSHDPYVFAPDTLKQVEQEIIRVGAF